MTWIKKHKILLIVLAVVLALLLSMFGFLWSKLDLIQYGEQDNVTGEDDSNDDAVLTDKDMEGLEQKDPVPADKDILADGDILNVLLIGTDDRTDYFSTNARSDSMILMSVNRKTGETKMVSLERGMGVPILSGQYEGEYDWLTHVFRYGGAELLLQTVRTCFKVDVTKYVRVNFRAMEKAVDAVGGISMTLSAAEAKEVNDEIVVNQGGVSNCVSGNNQLNGKQAVAYARIRKIDSDWGRVVRQRKVIETLMSEAKSSDLMELNALCDQVLPLLQTNFTKLELAELLLLAPSVMKNAGSIQQMTIPAKGTYGSMKGLGGRSLYAVHFDENARILHGFFYEGKTAEQAIAKPTTTTADTTTTTKQ